MSAQFDDGKDEGALRTIGEVSRALGIKTHVLRYWEQQFSILEPLKRSGGRRYYRSSDVELIERINQLVNDEGYTLKGAQQVIEAGGVDIASAGTGGEAATKSDPGTAPAAPAELPEAADGGVDAFFGRESYADTPTDIEPDVAEPEDRGPEDAVASSVDLDEALEVQTATDDESPSRAEILGQLRSIRTRLAEALAA